MDGDDQAEETVLLLVGGVHRSCLVRQSMAGSEPARDLRSCKAESDVGSAEALRQQMPHPLLSFSRRVGLHLFINCKV